MAWHGMQQYMVQHLQWPGVLKMDTTRMRFAREANLRKVFRYFLRCYSCPAHTWALKKSPPKHE